MRERKKYKISSFFYFRITFYFLINNIKVKLMCLINKINVIFHTFRYNSLLHWIRTLFY